jgi:hypothetical protein
MQQLILSLPYKGFLAGLLMAECDDWVLRRSEAYPAAAFPGGQVAT